MLSSDLDITQDKASYDSQSKYLISNKIILAKILSHVIDEFNDISVRNIIRYIEASPMIGSVAVNYGELIEGRTNDMTTINEGRNTFDILFDVYVPVKGTSEKRIINIEIQNNFYPGYRLEDRAEYYASRMISMQYGREMNKVDYNRLRKVYSLWINTNPPKHLVNTIYRKRMVPEFLQGYSELKENQLMNIIMMNLGKPEECTGVLRMLAVLLNHELSVKEKIEILEREYGINFNQREEKELKDMCDLADAIEKKGIQNGQSVLLTKLLRVKLGSLKNEIVMCIRNASQEILDKLIDNFMGVENEEEIYSLLRNS